MNDIIEHKPWQRRQDESAKAFHAFIFYRDMLSKERSLEKVLDKCKGKPSYYRHLARWSSRYEWVNRATAHDDYLDEVRAESQVHNIKEMAERQAKEGMALQKIGFEFLTGVGLVEARDAIRAVDVGAKLERIARGEPTEIIEAKIRLKPITEYTDEELQWTMDHGKPIEARKEIEG